MEKSDLGNAAEAMARRLVKLAQDRGSEDDISVVVNVYDWSSFPQCEDQQSPHVGASAHVGATLQKSRDSFHYDDSSSV